MTSDPVNSLRGLTILVVDDEPDLRELLGCFLEGCGAEVYLADAANAALAILAVHTPDVVISDIGMPGEDGYSLMRSIRSLGDDEKKAIPAIALTAFTRDADRARAFGAGFDRHMAKPLEAPALVQAVRELTRDRAAPGP